MDHGKGVGVITQNIMLNMGGHLKGVFVNEDIIIQHLLLLLHYRHCKPRKNISEE